MSESKDDKVAGYSLNSLQRKYPIWIKPIIKLLIFFRVGPNGLTLTAIPLALWAAYAIRYSLWEQAILAIGLAGLCDLMDGPLSRAVEKETRPRSERSKRFGEIIDPIVDRYTDCILLGGLFSNVYFHCSFRWSFMVFAILAFYFLSSWKRLHFKSAHYEIMERKMMTRTIFIVVFLLICIGMWAVNKDAQTSTWVLKVGIVSLLSAVLLPLIKRSISGFRVVWNGQKTM